MTKPIVLSLGELLWDLLPHGKRVGGAPANFAYHAQCHGAQSCMISAVGQDQLGDELIDKVNKAGIASIIQRNAWPTSTVEVTLKNGKYSTVVSSNLGKTSDYKAPFGR